MLIFVSRKIPQNLLTNTLFLSTKLTTNLLLTQCSFFFLFFLGTQTTEEKQRSLRERQLRTKLTLPREEEYRRINTDRMKKEKQSQIFILYHWEITYWLTCWLTTNIGLKKPTKPMLMTMWRIAVYWLAIKTTWLRTVLSLLV